MPEVQWSRKGGCLLVVRRTAPWKKNGCAIAPCSAICWRRPLTPPHRNWPKPLGARSSWVKKWRKRLREGDPHNQGLLCSRSRAHHAPYFRWDRRVETRIMEMRLAPPEHLGRTPGPRALLYYLPRDPDLQAAQVRLPQSTRTIWKILRKNGCIMLKPPRKLRSTESREPLEEIQMDFKDVESISPEQSRHRETPTYC